MYVADRWTDFAVLDAGGGMKLERWKSIRLLRPDPQAMWPMPAQKADAVYIRSSRGGGHWEFHKDLPESWHIGYADLRFIVRPTGFKHTGVFPEQAVNWDWMRLQLKKWKGKNKATPRVLNLFAYTGGATIACASEGAQLVHVDAAKGMVRWAKENACENRLETAPIRYLVDDCMKFVKREQQRGNRYDGIIMDPPSYGRGPTGEMWKIETDLWSLVKDCASLLSDTPAFVLVNAYTSGLSATVLKNVLSTALPFGQVEADEVGLPILRDNLLLPCGVSGRWTL